MEALLAEHDKLRKKGNLSKSIDDVQKTIDLLTTARNSIASGLSNPTLHDSLSSVLHIAD